ncbi:cellulase family glycosylhydrolase [Patescibacteria group bacterium]|nr:cellulase family glycosylhydrolase [Patescibacteria group bacterium]
MTKPQKIAFCILFSSLCLLAPLFLSVTTLQADKDTTWGVNYSESQAVYLGLDPKETYSAIIHDLGARHIKIHLNWNATEKERGAFDLSSLDWQVAEAERNRVQLILVIGMKTGRWPECHTPEWFTSVPAAERDAEIIRYVRTIVERYKDSGAVQYWQIENEPFLEFGTCPDWYYEDNRERVRAEIAAVRAIDPAREVIVSESGELSDWTDAAGMADIVGVTMYRSAWNDTVETFGINPYSFLTPSFYALKAEVIRRVYNKPVISIELQAEPWTSLPLAESSLEVQALSMNPQLFEENIEFARQAGLGTYYFWGAEWWYWMKTTHEDPAIWDSARALLAS